MFYNEFISVNQNMDLVINRHVKPLHNRSNLWWDFETGALQVDR